MCGTGKYFESEDQDSVRASGEGSRSMTFGLLYDYTPVTFHCQTKVKKAESKNAKEKPVIFYYQPKVKRK